MTRVPPLLLAALLAASAAWAATETLTVIVRTTSIRRDPQFYSPTLAEAAYGNKLTILERSRGWVKVMTLEATGWVHESALTEKKVKISSAAAGGGKVADEDVALAGKGFNPQVEGQYRQKNPKLDFAAVDRLEKIDVDERTLQAFVREGRLEARGGGR